MWLLVAGAQGDGGPSSEPTPGGHIGYYWLNKEKRLLKYDSDDADFLKLHEVLGALGDRPAAEADADNRNLEQYLRDHGVSETMIHLVSPFI
jgi:hypothetical protein